VEKLKKDLDILSKDFAMMSDMQKSQGRDSKAKAVKIKRVIPQEEVVALFQNVSLTAKKKMEFKSLK